MSITPKQVVTALAASLVILLIASMFYRECGYGGGMPGWYRDCDCKGIERVDYDQTAADGKRRTICLGVVTARTCHRYQYGPAVPCHSLPSR